MKYTELDTQPTGYKESIEECYEISLPTIGEGLKLCTHELRMSK